MANSTIRLLARTSHLNIVTKAQLMPKIILETKIQAPIQRVFDLARSIDLHIQSFKESGETVAAGRKKGLINIHEYVTWKGKHFGIKQRLTSAITNMIHPYFFEDKMIKGPFAKLEHQHYFENDFQHNNTIMKDVFYYQSPMGPIGCLADKIFLKNYLKQILLKRNNFIKSYAENDEKWMQILNIY
jgi:ligand-binding SRPBCC domain-containing protein